MARPYVSGLTIHDVSGKPLRIQGYNIEMRDVGITGGYPEFTQWLKDNGFNSVRAMVWWNNFEPTEGNYSAEYLGHLDSLMANCEAKGIYVNLCFHQWQYSDHFTYYGVGSGFPKWLLVAGGYDTTATGAKAFISDFWLNQGYGVTARQKYWGWWQFLINRYKNYNCIWAYELSSDLKRGV